MEGDAMIEEIAGLPEVTLEFKISGDVTGHDYDGAVAWIAV